MIYTSYFANIKNLPENIIPISICGKSPEGYKGLEFKSLAPKYWFFKEWKENKDNDFYIENYYKEVLKHTTVREVLLGILTLLKSNGYENNNYDICLVCYEKPEDFCHRHLVAQWFRDNGIKCYEYGREDI